ncbi:hypothetical protein [Ferirhizobium litorale]|uniref:Uncharacterized protein n=1 Tax=Ferirhizobium litorale TaxID=2927786 RepID=A0AAE3QEM5_9HYPH|nr:hypothetical protein [Fererhizobium litorale]MDI7922115.1 hypothetical protein [Fererhizobium litorale]
MTRHRMVEPAADAPPPATDPRVSMAIIATDGVATSRGQGRQYHAKEQRNGLSASTFALPIGGRAIAGVGRRSKSP